MVSRHISLHCCIFKPSISQNLSSTCLTAVFMSNSNFWLCRCLCDGIACYFHVTISYYLTVLTSCVSQPSTPHLLLSFERHKAGWFMVPCISNSALNLKKRFNFRVLQGRDKTVIQNVFNFIDFRILLASWLGINNAWTLVLKKLPSTIVLISRMMVLYTISSPGSWVYWNFSWRPLKHLDLLALDSPSNRRLHRPGLVMLLCPTKQVQFSPSSPSRKIQKNLTTYMDLQGDELGWTSKFLDTCFPIQIRHEHHRIRTAMKCRATLGQCDNIAFEVCLEQKMNRVTASAFLRIYSPSLRPVPCCWHCQGGSEKLQTGTKVA